MASKGGGAIIVMYQIMYTIYILYAISIFHVLWTKCDKIIELFEEIDTFAEKFTEYGNVPYKQKNVQRDL